MNNNSSVLFKTLGHKLGINSPATIRKAEELHRLLLTRGGGCLAAALTATAQPVVCLHLAATLTGDVFDKATITALSGLPRQKYCTQVATIGELLGVSPRATIHDLAITHSALASEDLARAALQHYCRSYNAGVDPSLALYQTAALTAACKVLKVKVEKRRLLETSGAIRSVFNRLVEKLVEVATKLNVKSATPSHSDSKKKERTLMDIVEDNLAAAAQEGDRPSNKNTKKRGSSTNHNDNSRGSKRAKQEVEEEEEEYEEWKRRILAEAKADEGKENIAVAAV